MSNTTTKVNSFIALGYSIAASSTPVKSVASAEVEDTTMGALLNDVIEEDNAVSLSNNIIKTLNIQINSSGLRV